jgi:hypothetical protein
MSIKCGVLNFGTKCPPDYCCNTKGRCTKKCDICNPIGTIGKAYCNSKSFCDMEFNPEKCTIPYNRCGPNFNNNKCTSDKCCSISGRCFPKIHTMCKDYCDSEFNSIKCNK